MRDDEVGHAMAVIAEGTPQTIVSALFYKWSQLGHGEHCTEFVRKELETLITTIRRSVAS